MNYQKPIEEWTPDDLLDYVIQAHNFILNPPSPFNKYEDKAQVMNNVVNAARLLHRMAKENQNSRT